VSRAWWVGSDVWRKIGSNEIWRVWGLLIELMLCGVGVGIEENA
jgi:hypothetical protein